MRNSLLLNLILIAFFSTGLKASHTLTPIIRGGQINCAVVLPENVTELQQIAADEFRSVIEQASGGSLLIATEGDSTGSRIPIFVGPSKATIRMGYSGDDLKKEEFRIIVEKDAIILLAKDIPNKNRPDRQSMVTAWAFAYLMDRYMGVVKIWPGDLGTVVPKVKNLNLPHMDIRVQPKLFYRSFRNAYDPDINLWNAFYQSAGFRESRAVLHSFRKGKNNGDWWGRFHEDKPEMLARGPDGKVGHAPGRPHFCKICISNPEVTDEIIRLWKEAGAPDYWDITPNDGTRFCTCDGCRELDRKYGDVEYTREEIWMRPAHVNLTDRYVWFWNQLISRMRETNPNIKVGVYFYSAYRNPPKKLQLEPGIFGAMVPIMDTTNWDAWIEAGASEIGLRPNWYYMGACGPSLHLHTMGNYIEHARENGMVLINMDSLYGFWATQGIKYYLTARLAQRYDLSTDDVIEEYCSAFGNAASDIRKYVDYWEAYEDKVAWNIPAGGMSSVNPDGLYESYCRDKFGKVLHPLQGHWRALSGIYSPDVMNKARDILQTAMAKAKDPLTRKRIDYLKAGLDHVELCAALVDAPKSEKQAFVRRVADFNKEMTREFGYWGSRELFMMQTFGILGKEINVDDM
ncbi:MAG: DUF4838 domain-containing protein [Puniceicoccaceae bacterium]